ncbi:MAG: 50S ribosomal protein L2 [Candidatus Lokiarchaeota archaeon]|nr:50S ribosomal protein L2 [Candidatus Lokiarchaeota archaeon]MBD3199315.1 50S ribosomal protein L2 [Candidatus Lokiarchaeota archaeon]
MGKRILAQRKGQGHLWARSPSHRHIGKVKYRPFKEDEMRTKFTIIDFVHSPGRGTPVAKILYEDGTKDLYLPPEGVYVGQEFVKTRKDIDKKKTIKAKQAMINVGNIVPLKDIPLGTLIFNIESYPGDGGKFARASGVAAIVKEHKNNKVLVQFRSKKRRWFNGNCLCTIGVVAGGGRTDKPFLKAGAKYYSLRSKAQKWPVVRGVTMNACSHPFGGGAKQSPHKPTTINRNAPPGRKVGQIAARRTGHKN